MGRSQASFLFIFVFSGDNTIGEHVHNNYC